MMPDTRACPSCKAPFSDAGLDVCAACLLAIAAQAGSSRARVLWRTFVAWSPVLANAALVLGGGLYPRASLIAGVVAILLMAGGLVYATLNPERGVQDRIAGTWLVPR
jgi:hypothetical protein